jgi:glycosyltransferase involved in cell wall biosynthesis
VKVVQIVKDNVGARWAYEQITWLTRHGVDITVFMPASAPGHMADLYREAGIPVVDLDPNLYPNGPARTLRNGRALRRALTGVAPDLVHVHHVATCLLLRLATGRRPSIPRVFEVHGPLHLESPHTRRVDFMTRSPDDYYVATSMAVHDIYRANGVGEDRLGMVYTGIETGEYVREPTGRLRAELGIGPDVPLVGMVAWFYPPKRILGQRVGLKGHDLFIRAIPRIAQRFPHARFVIVGGELSGSEGYARKLKEMAKALGVDDVLTFVGPRSDIPEIQPDLDVAVHPSRSENPGGAVYTLLSGVPTAGSRVGGIPEVVIDGRTGHLFDRDDVDGLVSAVVSLLDDPEKARAMALEGRALMQEMFDLENTSPRILEFYRRVLGERAAGRSRQGSGAS